MLIYLGSVLQKRVIPSFHYGLKPGGFLLLGAAETVGSFTDLFSTADRKQKIFVRKEAPVRAPFEFTRAQLPAEPAVSGPPPGVAAQDRSKEFDAQKEADRIVLSRYSPPGVVVNADMDIIHFRGHTGPFLEPAPGRASLNLLDMARGGLGLELRTAAHKATKTGTASRKEGIRIRYDGDYIDINLHVIPMKTPMDQFNYLVLFEEVPAPALLVEKGKPKRAGKNVTETGAGQELILARQELEETKGYLRTIVEEKEASNEELRAANEEIQSSNEELQSINEELETAKEELQSSNEELTTVNDELRNRNIELTTANDDLLNLFASVNLPTVMVGSDLCIRRITPTVPEALNIIPTDIGRPITDIKLKVNIPDLEKLVVEVIDTISVKSLEVQDTDGRWYGLRILPYKTQEKKIEGAVLALIDIDELKKSLESMAEAADMARILNSAHVAMVSSLDFDEVMRRVSAKAVVAMGCESDVVLMRKNDNWEISYIHKLPSKFLGRQYTDDQVPDLAQVARTGELLVVTDAQAYTQVASALIKDLGIKSLAAFPLKIKGEVVGAKVFHFRSAPGVFSKKQIEFGRNLAISLSLVLENVRLYAQEHRVAETLQSTLLTVPEDVPGLDIGHLYQTASWECAQVGGDFYEVHYLGKNLVCLVIGDVSGKGLEAAKSTSLIKNAIGVFSHEETSPAAILTRSNNSLIRLLPDWCIATVFVGVLNVESGQLRYCSAGHPPPVIKRAGGASASYLANGDIPLGVMEEHSYSDQTAKMKAGDIFIAYTDGLTEARRGVEIYGSNRLLKFIRRTKGVAAADFPQVIYDDVVDFTSGKIADDVAIISCSLRSK